MGRGHRGYALCHMETGTDGRGSDCLYCAPAGSGQCAFCHGTGIIEAEAQAEEPVPLVSIRKADSVLTRDENERG